MRKRPTILFVGGGIPPPYGGISKFFSLLLPGLVRRGFEVHLQLRPRGRILDAYQIYMEQGVHIHEILLPDRRQLDYGYRLLSLPLSNPKILSRIKDAASVDYLMRKRVALRHWMVLSHVLATEELARRHPIDLIHAHEDPLYYGTVGAAFRKNRLQAKYIHTIFGVVFPYTEADRYEADSHQFKQPIRRILSQADLLLSLTNHCAQTVKDVDLNPDQVKIITYTVDGDSFSPDIDHQTIIEKYGLQKSKVILFVGQIRPRKGPQILLDAAPIIFEKCPEARIIFVGPGEAVCKLEARANELGIRDKIIFTGAVDEAELPAYYAACDVFAFPSTSPIECLGLVMVQAMFSAKPIVASNIGGIPEVVVDGQTAFLVPPLQPDQLANKLLLLLQNRDLAAQMGVAGRQRALEKYDLEKVIDKFEQTYLDVWREVTVEGGG